MNSLQLVLVLLAVAVGVVVVCRLLHLPAVLGYLIVGIAIGPHDLGWIPDTPEARDLGKFGVVFLMFSIGLEFSLERLRSMQRLVFGLGTAQVVATMLLVMVASLWFGLDWRAGLALGGVLAMSSTAIVSKMLVERAELTTSYGQKIMGVLLFQDLAVVPLIILISALGGDGNEVYALLGLAVLKAALILTVLLTFGQRLLRPWFDLVAQQKSPELFMLNILLFTLGLGWITEMAGLSMALGAFVAGMLIAETQYRFEVEEDIKPFRDVLLGLFFVTIGMRLDPLSVIDGFGWVVLTLLILLPFKAMVVTLLARKFSDDWDSAIHSGLGLAQAGEFGFVLLTLTGDANLLPADVTQNVLAAMLISMLASPFLIQYAGSIVRRISPAAWMNRAMQIHQIAVQSMSADAHLIICGYGRSGQTLGRFMDQENIRYMAIDLDPNSVREAAETGKSVVYGDATKREVLLAAGLMRARALVVTYDETHSALRILQHVRELRPDLPVVVRTTDDAHIEELKNAGAAEVVAEVLEGSVMLASQAMLMFGVPLNKVIRRVQDNRARRYSMFSGLTRPAGYADEPADSQQPRFHSVMLDADDYAVGKTLDEIDLPALQVEINSVRRYNVRGQQPAGNMVLKTGDVLMLLGLPQPLMMAEKRLRDG
ncbi:MAG: cation:proton antiporter [Gallionellaceae bacterium]|jgi:CPA2 family monovalent cation:H+ antiporter-2|nr:cation:proton antiporter [Gallionellaceae bacterium]